MAYCHGSQLNDRMNLPESLQAKLAQPEEAEKKKHEKKQDTQKQLPKKKKTN